MYEDLANIFAGESEVVVAKMDASAEENSEIATKYEVSGFPTLKWFGQGSQTAEAYEGGRDISSLISFINEKAGTFREQNGSLSATAGRIQSLDDMISNASTIDTTLLNALKSAVSSITGKSSKFAELYLSVAGKIISKGSEYVEKEVGRLAGMIANPNVAPEKKTGFMLRQNVLKAFQK